MEPTGLHTMRPATGQSSAGNGIRTREYLRNRILSPAPLAWLGYPRMKGIYIIFSLFESIASKPLKASITILGAY